MPIIQVKLHGQSQLQAFAKDIEEAVRKIHGKSFTIFIEKDDRLATQLPNQHPVSIGQAMRLADDIIKAHHLRVFRKPVADGGAGPSERAVMQQFVSELAHVRRGKPKSGRSTSLREEAQNAMGQARSLLPKNRALAAAYLATGKLK